MVTPVTCGSIHEVCVDNELWEATGAFAHICSAAFFVLGIAVLMYVLINFSPFYSLVITSAIILIYAPIKEYWFDERAETVDERGNNSIDVATYYGGMLLGDLLAFGLHLRLFGYDYHTLIKATTPY